MRVPQGLAIVALSLGLAACGDDGGGPDIDAGVTTAHCTYEDVPANAGTGTPVAPAPLMAGAAEVPFDIPVGTALGGYTARGSFIGTAGTVDNRDIPISGGFFPSVGIETRPMAKTLVLRAGGETVVWIKADAIFAYEGFVFELEERLGPEYRGKVLLSTSHSHSAWAQYTTNTPLKVGASEARKIVYDRFLAACEASARAAIANLQPASIGFFTDANFDPTDSVSRERRGENDDLPGGHRKDDVFHLIRVDTAAGAPLAIVPIWGMHGTLNGEDNPLASTDAIGGVERLVEEQFDRQVVVMHVQSAGADTSPAGHGGLDCSQHPGEADDPCLQWLSAEGTGRAAVSIVMDAWTAAGTAMSPQLALAMVTRSVELGPDPATFTIRGGALAYAPFSLDRTAPDLKVYEDSGAIASPIDEFNAPVGAALCETDTALFPAAAMPGVEGLAPYGSCVRIDAAGEVLSQILKLSFPDIGPDRPACSNTRTTLSALRLGDYLVATMPGELSVLLADKLRAASPVDANHTIAIGYSQGHVGYMLTPEDWLLGGYEPSVTFWGPLESEYLLERLTELMPLALGANRADGAAGGASRVVPPTLVDDLPIDDPATRRGTVPATIPEDLWMRAGRPASAQPPATVPRVNGLATFVWYGDDSMVKTPEVTLQRQAGPGWVPVTRRSGRAVSDGDLILVYAPVPLIRVGNTPQDHLWAVEWQPVPWTGLSGTDELDHRGRVPMLTYRFHVVGDGWTLDSDPFDVVAADLSVGATRSGSSITATVSLYAPKGYRLMDLAIPSNHAVPLRATGVSVIGHDSSGAIVGGPRPGTTDGNGRVTVDFGAAAASVVRVEVVDLDGNSGSATL